MKILFLTLFDITSFSAHNLYSDLLREFIKNGHDVYCISPYEKQLNGKTHFEEDGHLLKLNIGNTQKTSIIKKGISTLLVEHEFKVAIQKYFSEVKFDFVLYSTPPITLVSAVGYVKKRDHAQTYLLLKDIFPQNAVDLGMMKTTGVKGILYRYFRKKEKKLYEISDRIGCMSQANVDYIIKHNPEIDPAIVEICPNSIEVQDLRLSDTERLAMREKYGIPADKKVFVYGGNLGKPQGIPFLIDCLRAEKNNEKVFFLIVGDGTEYGKLEAFVNEENPINVKLMRRLPRNDYDRMIAACDVGMIFLDHRFTIPNFPSRLLSYMQAGLPVLACTDPNTDIGKVIIEGSFGWWCESDSTAHFEQCIDQTMQSDLHSMGTAAFEYLQKYYSVKDSYLRIVKSIE